MDQCTVLAVLVVYGRCLDDVASWSLLQASLVESIPAASRLQHLLIYDNSPISRANISGPQQQNLSYVHDAANGGTAAAYAYATELALRLKCEWLLFLDQDTVLPSTFISSANLVLQKNFTNAIAAIVPHVRHGTRQVSPARLTRFGTVRPLNNGEQMNARGCITAIASGSFIRASVLRSILPFPTELWLDHVDHWIFTELHKLQASVLIFNETLAHDLSIESPQLLSRSRLFSILDGEIVLNQRLGIMARCVYPFRIVARVIRYAWISPKLAMYTLAWIVRRKTNHL